MATISVVEELPQLRKEDFPPLPVLPLGTCVSYKANEAEQKLARQIVAAAVVSGCAHQQQWGGVIYQTVDKYLRHSQMMIVAPEKVVMAFWEMIDDEVIEVLQLRSTIGPEGLFIIPTPEMCALLRIPEPARW